MGQYYKVVNLRDRQYLHPHRCGDGLKLLEICMSGNGTLSILAAAIASTQEHQGPWAGAPLVVAGDYADPDRFVPPKAHEAAEPGEDSKANLHAYVAADDSGYVDASTVLRDEARKATGVCIRASFGMLPKGEVSKAMAGLVQAKELTSLEELFELFDEVLDPSDTQASLSHLLRGFRVSGIDCECAWWQVLEARFLMAEGNGFVLAGTLENRERSKTRTIQLDFPVTPAALAKLLGFEEALQQARDCLGNDGAGPEVVNTSTAREVLRPDLLV